MSVVMVMVMAVAMVVTVVVIVFLGCGIRWGLGVGATYGLGPGDLRGHGLFAPTIPDGAQEGFDDLERKSSDFSDHDASQPTCLETRSATRGMAFAV